MCICILKKPEGYISRERLEQAYNANPDGWGLLWNDYHMKFCYKKDVSSFSKFFYGYYLDVWNYDMNEIIIHFRTAASKGFGNEYCHPHFVNENLAFVHNGNFYEFSSGFKNRKRDNKTDTMRFNDEVLKKLPNDFLENKEIVYLLNEYCKYNLSKMIFMNNKGKTWIINEESGEWKDGCWYSNKGMNNYQGYGYSGAYYYNYNDIRHKGGLPTIQYLSKENRKNWWKCNSCDGWFSTYYMVKLGDYGLCQGCLLLEKLKGYCNE